MSTFSPEVSQRVNDLAAKNDGRVTPDMVVRDAKKKSSPLHSLFEWDVEKAAMSSWIERARVIIRSVRVEVRTTRTNITAVAYVRDPRCGNGEQGYTSLQKVAKSPADAAGVMAYELGRAEATLSRCFEISGVLGLESETRDALARVIAIRKAVDKRRGVNRGAAVAPI